MHDLVLILEDDAERVAGFRSALMELGPAYKMRVWRNAHAMISQAGDLLGRAFAVYLDHDLNPMPGEAGDPGTGLDVAAWLSQHTPVCPVVVHSSRPRAGGIDATSFGWEAGIVFGSLQQGRVGFQATGLRHFARSPMRPLPMVFGPPKSTHLRRTMRPGSAVPWWHLKGWPLGMPLVSDSSVLNPTISIG